MSVRRLASDDVQPASFAFTVANENWVQGQISKYPEGRQASAVIPLLWKAQEQAGGWLPRAAIEAVATRLGMPNIRVMEVATFYTMFNLSPVGRYFVQLCGTVPCHLCGALDLKAVCERVIGPQSTVSADGKLSWLEVECLGACCNAPMVQINNDYYEDLNPQNFEKLLEDLRAGRPVKTGSQSGRSCSEPLGGGETLRDAKLYDGSAVGAGDWQARVRRERQAGEAAKALAAQAAAAAPAAAPVAAPATVAASTATAAPARPVSPGPINAALDTPASGGKALKAKGSVSAPGAASQATTAKAAPVKTAKPEDKPQTLAGPRGGKADDLKWIWGVGPKIEKMLNGMGVWHFDQIAGWDEKNLAWVDENLEGFYGRAGRDDWIGQAKKLATGWKPENAVGDKPVKKV
jgi:NADH-quinone oxidoreductase subunit E